MKVIKEYLNNSVWYLRFLEKYPLIKENALGATFIFTLMKTANYFFQYSFNWKINLIIYLILFLFSQKIKLTATLKKGLIKLWRFLLPSSFQFYDTYPMEYKGSVSSTLNLIKNVINEFFCEFVLDLFKFRKFIATFPKSFVLIHFLLGCFLISNQLQSISLIISWLLIISRITLTLSDISIKEINFIDVEETCLWSLRSLLKHDLLEETHPFYNLELEYLKVTCRKEIIIKKNYTQLLYLTVFLIFFYFSVNQEEALLMSSLTGGVKKAADSSTTLSIKLPGSNNFPQRLVPHGVSTQLTPELNSLFKPPFLPGVEDHPITLFPLPDGCLGGVVHHTIREKPVTPILLRPYVFDKTYKDSNGNHKGIQGITYKIQVNESLFNNFLEATRVISTKKTDTFIALKKSFKGDFSDFYKQVRPVLWGEPNILTQDNWTRLLKENLVLHFNEISDSDSTHVMEKIRAVYAEIPSPISFENIFYYPAHRERLSKNQYDDQESVIRHFAKNSSAPYFNRQLLITYSRGKFTEHYNNTPIVLYTI